MSPSNIKKSFSVGIITALIFFSFTIINSSSMALAQNENKLLGNANERLSNSGLGSLSGLSSGLDTLQSTISSEPANAAASTNSISCGQVIEQSIKLSANLDCRTDGIIIGKSGITVDLNGYTITGPGIDTSKVGLMLADADSVNVVGPGTIQNFQAGILNTGGQDNKISGLTFTKNAIAVFNTGSANTEIGDNLIFSNNIGVASHSSEAAKLVTNLFMSNKLAGITFVNSADNSVVTNTIQGSLNGLFIDGQSRDNIINSNNVLKNTGVDLNNANGLPTNINNNAFTDNNCNTSVPVGLCLGR